MKKILIIHQSSELYGSDKMLLIFLQNINKNNFFFVVILPTEGPLKVELEKIGIEVIILPVLKLYRDIFTFKNGIKFLKDTIKSVGHLNKLHKSYKFDLVYSNTLAVLLGAIFSYKQRIKHIWHVHEIIEHPKIIAWFFPKLLYHFSDKIICNSSATENNIVKRELRNSGKTIVVHNGIPFNENPKDFSKKEFGFSDEDIIITLVGRISRLKGHKWVLETINKYFKNNRNIKILFVGSPVPNQEHYLLNIEEYIQSNNLSNTVKIIPFTTNLEGIWSVTDIALMPSTEKESFGLVAVEAMLAKKPVIASNHGGLKEIVSDNENGFLVEPNNNEAFKLALEKLINDPLMRKKFGDKGYQTVISKFSVEKYVQKIEDILEKI